MKRRHISIENLILFLLGELPPDDAENLQNHLNRCASCRNRMESEKSLLRILKRQHSPVPSESILTRHRARLMQKLRISYPSEPRQSVWARIMDRAREARPYNLQWATVAVVFCLGLIAGKIYEVIPKHSGTMSLREAMLVLESSAPIRGLDVGTAGLGRDNVEIRFTTMREYTVSGRLSNRGIQRALSCVLRHSPGDHIRLRALNLLAQGKPDRDEVREALIHTLENDENPGVRLKAIQLLIDAFPVNATLKNVMVRAFVKDPNEGIRIEAANLLNRLTDPVVIPLLRQQASTNPYVQSLLMKEQ